MSAMDTASGLAIALALAYFVTVADSVARHLLAPTPPKIRATSPFESQSAPCVRECPPGCLRAESVEQEGFITAR